MIRFAGIILCLLLTMPALGQPDSLSIESIESRFKSFEYLDVIILSEKYLQQQSSEPEELMSILEMRVIAYYSLGEVKASLTTFLEIMNINPDFAFDPLRTSPKIIRFFEEVRKIVRPGAPLRMPPDPEYIDSLATAEIMAGKRRFRWVIARSLLMPGTGHLAEKRRQAGWTLLMLNTTLIAGSVYNGREMQRREKAYLNAVELADIEAKYSRYNSAYRVFRGTLAAYGIFWLYSQLDLLFYRPNTANSSMKAATRQPRAVQSSFLPRQGINGTVWQLQLQWIFP